LCLVLSGAARAAEAERPWAAGVPPERQTAALALFKQGNQQFEESQYLEALAIYKRAIALWDHPAIRYNLAVAHIHLDQPLEAYENLEPALRYGAAPLGGEVHTQALTYQKLLLGQLAELQVSCREPGARVELDGARLFVGPGETTRRLRPGSHQLVAAKPGFLTESRAVLLLPGKLVVEKLAPTPLKALATRRRWAVWKPWVVGAAGIAAGLAGLPLMLQSVADRDAYDAAIEQGCQMGGCPRGEIPGETLALSDRFRAENGAAIAAFALGGGLVVSAIVLLALNTPRIVERPQR
jgi:tetratricopeptide (TPR) repeat protein